MMEPEEGKYDFEWLDKVVEIADKNGLKVIMCTPYTHTTGMAYQETSGDPFCQPGPVSATTWWSIARHL